MDYFSKLNLLWPGMKKRVEKNPGSTLGYNGSVPAIFFNGAGIELSIEMELSIERIVKFFDFDDYAGLNAYVDSIIAESIALAQKMEKVL